MFFCVQIGVVGLTIANKTMQSSSPSPGTTLTDEKAAAQQEINALKATGVNKIVVLSHVGLPMDEQLAAELTDVDVIVGGDSHTLLGDSARFAAGPGGTVTAVYPKEVTNNGKKVCIVQAWEYAHVVGMLDVVFNDAGEVTSCQGAPVVPIADQSTWRDDDGLMLTTQQKETVYTAIKGSPAMPHAVVTAELVDTKTYLTSSSAKVTEMQAKEIVTFGAKHCFERVPGEGRSKICTKCDSYVKGGAACNLVAHSFMMQQPSAHIGIQNGGGCREDIKIGKYTIANAYTMLPFSNTLVTLKMTGAEIVQVLEDSLEFTFAQKSTGAYPYAAGLRFEVDASKAKGSRVTNVEVNPRVASAWTAIVLTDTYTVITNDYIAGGKDGYTTMGSITGDKRVNTYTEYAQGLINFIQTQPAVATATVAFPDAQYSTKKFTNSTGIEHTAANCPGAVSSRRAAHVDMSKCKVSDANYTHQVKMTVSLAVV